ncbi:hypothetical protein MAA_11448 [Metarhizium robertsii ARSEF 23]|uniref:Uncharacterized protein n=1 Tax=Metarhizium robertsii (strain ARSEF 23 / ATCC MYA-3075) TaxID=655844 RepID=A0A0B2XG35_METRA|nr:uncharacterized protein MAA_11448 [Metarhizium robertsii ARSEF 23]KHO10911.1 hypothetical protein MAA_11448 [Metarhizium robertsii ARSEF 23]
MTTFFHIPRLLGVSSAYADLARGCFSVEASRTSIKYQTPAAVAETAQCQAARATAPLANECPAIAASTSVDLGPFIGIRWLWGRRGRGGQDASDWIAEESGAGTRQTPARPAPAYKRTRRDGELQFVRSSTRRAGVGACMMQASKGTSVGSQKRQPSDMLCSRRRPGHQPGLLCHQRRPFSNYLPSIACRLSGYLFLRVLLDLPRASLPPPPGARRIRLELYTYQHDVCMVPVAPFLPNLPTCLRTVCTYTCVK